MFVLNTWMLILKYLKLDRIIFSQQAVSGAISNIDTGGEGGSTFNTKKEIETIYYIPHIVVITLLSGLCLHRFNKNHPSNICYDIKTTVFILNFPQIFRSFNKNCLAAARAHFILLWRDSYRGLEQGV